MKLYYLTTHWADSKLHHNSSCLQLSAADSVRLRVLSLRLIKTLWPSSPGYEFIDNEIKEISKYGLHKITEF